MLPFLSDFHDRKRQARHYLAVVLTAERLSVAGRTTRAQERRLLTLRAGAFLLLYNLIEASTRGAVEAIHDRITTETVPFEQLTVRLRKEVVRLFKNNANIDVHHTIVDFPSAFVGAALSVGVKLSGNVDAALLRELGEIYGFSCATDSNRTCAGSDLLTIKAARNDLSHGRRSFEEVGREYPAGALSKLSHRSLGFMNQVLLNIASYLDNRLYLDPPAVGLQQETVDAPTT